MHVACTSRAALTGPAHEKSLVITHCYDKAYMGALLDEFRTAIRAFYGHDEVARFLAAS